MKSAIFINDKVTQFILTPEDDFEKRIIEECGKKDCVVSIFHGNFANCNGGYIRQYNDEDNRQSLMIYVRREIPNDHANA